MSDNNISPSRPSSGGAGGVSRQQGSNRPQRPPKSDFKKYSKDNRPSDDEDDSKVSETEQEEADANPPSLFDLSRDKQKGKPAAQPKTRMAGESQEDASALEMPPSSAEDTSSTETASKIRIPAKEQPLDYITTLGEDVPSTDKEPDQDLTALTPKKTSAQPQQMASRREDRDQRLFENLLAKNTDEILPEDPLAKAKGEKEGIASRFSADTESDKHRVKTTKDGEDEGAGSMLSEGDEIQQPVEEPKRAGGDKKITPDSKEKKSTQTERSPSPTEIKESGKESGRKELGANEIGRQQADQVQAMKSKRTDTPANRAEEIVPVTKKEKSKEGSRSGSDEGERNPNFASANPSIQSAGLGADKSAFQDTQETSRAATIRDIAAQIVDKIQVMRDNDSTKTIVTLKHPPILMGATVTLTASDNAKSEFNISFANLSPDAKMFLDRKLNEDSLTQTLERKGIVVHMVTTTTQAETLTVQTGQPSKEDQQQQQREQSREQQQREREQQEEENET